MNRNRFSVTTLILVALMVSALVWAGRMVNPPPAAPPEAPKAAPADSIKEAAAPSKETVAAQQKMMKEKMKQMMIDRKRHQKELDGMQAANAKKKFDPNQIDVTPSVFQQGAGGGEEAIKEMNAKLEAAKAEAKQHPTPAPRLQRPNPGMANGVPPPTP